MYYVVYTIYIQCTYTVKSEYILSSYICMYKKNNAYIVKKEVYIPTMYEYIYTFYIFLVYIYKPHSLKNPSKAYACIYTSGVIRLSESRDVASSSSKNPLKMRPAPICIYLPCIHSKRHFFRLSQIQYAITRITYLYRLGTLFLTIMSNS